jgi:uncharacterized membrane protein
MQPSAESHFRRALRLALVGLMVFAGVSHFVTPAFFTVMVPPQLPSPLALVLISGVAEIALGLGLLHPRLRRRAGQGLIALYIAVFPANLYMALAEVPLAGIPTQPWMLWARLPLQAVFIAWAYAVSRPAPAQPEATARNI